MCPDEPYDDGSRPDDDDALDYADVVLDVSSDGKPDDYSADSEP